MFGDKINLSNTDDADFVDAEIIASDDGSVIIIWWERNATVNEPVANVSSDYGLTFGPVLNLANNGPIENLILEKNKLVFLSTLFKFSHPDPD